MNINYSKFAGILCAVSFTGVSMSAFSQNVADVSVENIVPDVVETTPAPNVEQVLGKMGRIINKDEYARMKKYVDELVSPRDVIDTFISEAGDTVDCVDIYRQPAMKRIGMENHVIATPPELPGLDEASAVAEEKDVAVPEQSAVENGQVCPEGSVPIRRVTMETMKNFRTLEDFRKKVPSHLEEPRAGASSLHQYAHAYRYVSNLGAETVLNLWSPYVERSNEFSLSQMWVVRGSGADLETVEAGWQEYKDLYGDWRSRLFIYFTPDAYGSGGCYNLTCGAFVQYSSSVYIGGAFSSYSSAGGTQQEITLRWHKGGSNNAWWLRYGNTWVGYYPQNLFDASGLRNQASVIDFGGEIIDRHVGRHTFTDMGSGYFPSSGFGYAAYQRSIKYLTTSGSLADATGLTASRTDSWCYDINLVSSTGSWGVYFFFGGSGYNVNCQ